MICCHFCHAACSQEGIALLFVLTVKADVKRVAPTSFCKCCCTVFSTSCTSVSHSRLNVAAVAMQSLYTGVYSRGGPTNIEPSNELSALLDRSPANVRGVKFSGSPGVRLGIAELCKTNIDGCSCIQLSHCQGYVCTLLRSCSNHLLISARDVSSMLGPRNLPLNAFTIVI